MKRTLFTIAMLTLAPSALAQDAIDLPAICTADNPHAGMDMGDMGMDGGGMSMGGDAAHVDLMDGMAAMNRDMMVGGTAKDIDVAFVCSMIPHHRGAIDMAQAQIAHGDDPWAIALAETIIAAQEKEIAEMLEWLEAQK